MAKEEKLEKAVKNFCLLSEEKQEYILGILQALVFAHTSSQIETFPFDSDQKVG